MGPGEGVRLAWVEGALPLRRPTAADPWRVLTSACLSGLPTGWTGDSHGDWPLHAAFARLDTVRLLPFCPEDHAFGTPRALSDLHGGDGFDALDGKARVLTTGGEDWTADMVAAAAAMRDRALAERVDFALLLDISAACGTQVISWGDRTATPRRFQARPGVAAAALLRAGIPVVSQRDHRTLHRLLALADPGHPVEPDARDHHQGEWFVETFGPGATRRQRT